LANIWFKQVKCGNPWMIIALLPALLMEVTGQKMCSKGIPMHQWQDSS